MCPERTKGVDREPQNSVSSAASLLSRRWANRHPDHVSASHVLSNAVFDAGFRRYDASVEAWKPRWLCYDFINDSAAPSFALDVSAPYDRKRPALACYASQFWPTDRDSVATGLTSPGLHQLVDRRDAHLGTLAGVQFAERIVVREPILRTDFSRENQS